MKPCLLITTLGDYVNLSLFISFGIVPEPDRTDFLKAMAGDLTGAWCVVATSPSGACLQLYRWSAYPEVCPNGEGLTGNQVAASRMCKYIVKTMVGGDVGIMVADDIAADVVAELGLEKNKEESK